MDKFILILIAAGISSCFAKSPLISNSVTEYDDGCACKTYSCGCCFTMLVPEIKLNDTACVNFAYLPDEYGISVTLTIDDKAIINETISARNPPPLCVEPPALEKVVHICLRFYDISVTSALFHSCVQFEIKMFYIFMIEEIKLGCFNIDLEKVKQIKYLEQKLETKDNVTLSNSISAKSDKKIIKEKLANKRILTPSRW